MPTKNRLLLALSAMIAACAIIFAVVRFVPPEVPESTALDASPDAAPNRLGAFVDPAKVQVITVPSDASATTIGSSFSLPAPIDRLGLVAKIPALDGGSLTLYAQGSWDQGTTWYDWATFPTEDAATAPQVLYYAVDAVNGLSKVPIGTSTADAATPSLAVGVLAPPVPPLLRLVAITGSTATVDGGSVDASVSFFSTRPAL